MKKEETKREYLECMIQRLTREKELHDANPHWNNPHMMWIIGSLTETELERYKKELAELEEEEKAAARLWVFTSGHFVSVHYRNLP